MTTLEKILVLLALFILITVPVLLVAVPSLHTLPLALLLPISIPVFIANATLLFIVFKDIFTRPFSRQSKRYFWALLVFFFPPSTIIYLPLHGFKPRKAET